MYLRFINWNPRCNAILVHCSESLLRNSILIVAPFIYSTQLGCSKGEPVFNVSERKVYSLFFSGLDYRQNKACITIWLWHTRNASLEGLIKYSDWVYFSIHQLKVKKLFRWTKFKQKFILKLKQCLYYFWNFILFNLK